jgi:hypothetical protein
MPNNGVNYAFLKLTKFKLNNQGKSEITNEKNDQYDPIEFPENIKTL